MYSAGKRCINWLDNDSDKCKDKNILGQLQGRLIWKGDIWADTEGTCLVESY
jgi:hypothetical protein